MTATALSTAELRRTRDALVKRLALAADDLELLGAGAPRDARERWILRAGSYVAERQAAVDRLAEIDAALGGEAPDPTCRGALERILEADRLLLTDAGRLMAEIHAESADLQVAAGAARRYLSPVDPGPLLTRTM
jgi:hypothetical protein